MAAVTGTHDISSLLAARIQSPAEFGLDTIQQILEADTAAHNAIVRDMVAGLADPTTDRQRLYGSSLDGEMVEVDEFGRGPAQKDVVGSTVAFPLKLFQFNLGWTERWMLTHTPADMAQATQASQKAHWRAIQREIKRALFNNANYTWRDTLVDNVDLAVKRLVNADSAPIPPGPNGEAFTASTHTHYVARVGTLAISDVTSLVNNVVEHGHGGDIKIVINRADEATIRALTGTNGFVAYQDPRMIFNATDVANQRLDISRMDDRAIGLFGAAEVLVKPWGVANYWLCYDASGAPPLAFRENGVSALQGLRMVAQNKAFPLEVQYNQAEYGLGVWNRTNGAVLYIGATTWANPTIS